jgi:molybdopterin synthase catalytic subunit
MRATVLFFGVLKDLVGRAEDTVEVAPATTVAQLLGSYVQRFATLGGKRSSILFARNREFVTADTPITENDEIAFLPPVSGGSDATQDIYAAITRNVIDSQSLARQIQRPDDGAVIVFEGVVRNNTKGRGTLYLDYEGYEPMALQQMTAIANQIKAVHAIGRIGMVHRLGRLAIGEASVVIVVSAPHRRPAYDASLEAINRLKKEVPIWKKEYFADGAVWVDGEWDERLLAGSLHGGA